MFSAYVLLKALHVISVVLWVGGVVALWRVTVRLGRTGNRAAVAALLPLALRYGQAVAMPAAIVVLLSGIVMIVVAHLGGPLWVQIGFLGIVLQIVIGATVIRKTWNALGTLASAATPDDARFSAALSRLSVTTWVYLVIMIVVIAAMVLKPTV